MNYIDKYLNSGYQNRQVDPVQYAEYLQNELNRVDEEKKDAIKYAKKLERQMRKDENEPNYQASNKPGFKEAILIAILAYLFTILLHAL